MGLPEKSAGKGGIITLMRVLAAERAGVSGSLLWPGGVVAGQGGIVMKAT